MLSFCTDESRMYHSALQEPVVRRYLPQLRLHHPETCEHSLRVGHDCAVLGLQEGLSHEYAFRLCCSGLLHDIGKLGVPRHVLSKNGPLDDSERKAVRMHPRYAFEWLRPYGVESRVVVAHHELSSDPYPRNPGAPGPFSDRRRPEPWLDPLKQMLAVADMFDALVSARDYKPALARDEAISIMRCTFRGDPKYVDMADELLSRRGPCGSASVLPEPFEELREPLAHAGVVDQYAERVV